MRVLERVLRIASEPRGIPSRNEAIEAPEVGFDREDVDPAVAGFGRELAEHSGRITVPVPTDGSSASMRRSGTCGRSRCDVEDQPRETVRAANVTARSDRAETIGHAGVELVSIATISSRGRGVRRATSRAIRQGSPLVRARRDGSRRGQRRRACRRQARAASRRVTEQSSIRQRTGISSPITVDPCGQMDVPGRSRDCVGSVIAELGSQAVIAHASHELRHGLRE